MTNLDVFVLDGIHNDGLDLAKVHEGNQLLQALDLHDRVHLGQLLQEPEHRHLPKKVSAFKSDPQIRHWVPVGILITDMPTAHSCDLAGATLPRLKVFGWRHPYCGKIVRHVWSSSAISQPGLCQTLPAVGTSCTAGG